MNIIKLFVTSYLILFSFTEWDIIHCMEEKVDAYDIGACYYEGIGVGEDKVEAVKWFQKAAEEGHVTAQFRLSICYEIGEGVAQNKVEAVKWLQRAAEQGHIIAQFRTGVCYEKGEVVNQDKAEALKWFQKAAHQGNVPAQQRVIKLNSERLSHSSFASKGNSLNINSTNPLASQTQMKHPRQKNQKQNDQKTLSPEEFKKVEEDARKAMDELIAEEAKLKKSKQPTRGASRKIRGKGKENKKKEEEKKEPAPINQITSLKKATGKPSSDKLDEACNTKISAVGNLPTITHSPQVQKQDNASKRKKKGRLGHTVQATPAFEGNSILASPENRDEATNNVGKIKKKRNQKDYLPTQEIKEQEKKAESKEEENKDSKSELLEQTEPKTISVNSIAANDNEEKAPVDPSQPLPVDNQPESISNPQPKSHKQKGLKPLWGNVKEIFRKKKTENQNEAEKEVKAENNINMMSSPVLYPAIPTTYMNGETGKTPHFSGQIRYIQVPIPFPIKIPIYIPVPITFLHASGNMPKLWIPHTHIKYEDDKKIVAQWNDEGSGSIHIIHPDSDAIEQENNHLNKRIKHLKSIIKMCGYRIEDQGSKTDRNSLNIVHHGGEAAKQKNEELKKNICYLEKCLQEMNLELSR